MAHDRTTGSAPVEQGGEAVAKAPASGEATHAVDANGNNGGPAHTQASFWGLLIGSIGVVYGDIGTSPLYAFREAVMAATGH